MFRLSLFFICMKQQQGKVSGVCPGKYAIETLLLKMIFTEYLWREKQRRINMFEKIALSGVSSTEWLRLRKTGIGGSDAGAICGVNPYSSAMKVFQDKTREGVEEQDSEAVRIGHDLEDYVAQRFMEATGLKVRKSNFMYLVSLGY